MGKNSSPIVMMKLPVESTAISLPTEVVQFTPFDVTLQLDTEALASRLNDIIARSPHGVAMQGISGKVHASMQAEIVGNGFHIDNPGPQVQLFSGQSGTLWSWTVTPNCPQPPSTCNPAPPHHPRQWTRKPESRRYRRNPNIRTKESRRMDQAIRYLVYHCRYRRIRPLAKNTPPVD